MAELSGLPLLASTIIYGAGPRVSEVVAIRVKDLNLTSRELMIRAGKGNKDRITVLPDAAIGSIRDQMEAVADQHALDLEAGRGWAFLPGALHRKDPEAGWDLAWQFLFPSTQITKDPKTDRRGRRPIHITSLQRPIKTAWRKSLGLPRVRWTGERLCFSSLFPAPDGVRSFRCTKGAGE